jgi:hypothetical protein
MVGALVWHHSLRRKSKNPYGPTARSLSVSGIEPLRCWKLGWVAVTPRVPLHASMIGPWQHSFRRRPRDPDPVRSSPLGYVHPPMVAGLAHQESGQASRRGAARSIAPRSRPEPGHGPRVARRGARWLAEGYVEYGGRPTSVPLCRHARPGPTAEPSEGAGLAMATPTPSIPAQPQRKGALVTVESSPPATYATGPRRRSPRLPMRAIILGARPSLAGGLQRETTRWRRARKAGRTGMTRGRHQPEETPFVESGY